MFVLALRSRDERPASAVTPLTPSTSFARFVAFEEMGFPARLMEEDAGAAAEKAKGEEGRRARDGGRGRAKE